MINRVYIFDINNFDGNKSRLEMELSKQILSFISKYKLEDDYLRSLIAWYLLKKYIKDDFFIDLNEENIVLNEMGKPYIESEVYFNISHSNNFVAVIISESECGIDIEVYDKKRNWEVLKKNILTESELNSINDNVDIVKYWSIKEAYFKMLGTGITLSKLHENVDFTRINTMNLTDSKGDEYYLSYICNNDDNTKIKMIKVV